MTKQHFNLVGCGLLGLFSLLALGCVEPPPVAEKKTGIIGKTTQDIGEYDPEGEAKIADLQVDANNPLAAATGTYKYAAGTTSMLTIQHAMNLFNAEHDRYPKDHAEFMEVIIKKNNIQLPVMPGGRRYQYDVENHTLVVVEAEKKDP
jgi:hypothetical protein